MADTTFAQRLQYLREQAGLSQYALARKTGLSKQALSNLELGRREPTWHTVQLLVAALGVSCEAFKDPGLKLPEEQPAPQRGRPPKKAEDAAPPKGRGKGSTPPQAPPKGKKGRRKG